MRAFWYPVALIVGVVLGFAFTEILPLMIFGEGAIDTDLGAASILGFAAVFPGLFVGGVILRTWTGAATVAIVSGVVTFAVYMLDLIERPPPEPLVWPTFLVPAVAVVIAGILDWRRTLRVEA